MSAFEVRFPGRPVPWDRTAVCRTGKHYNRPRALLHRRTLAKAMQFAEGRRAFEGPVRLTVVFDYERDETLIRFEEVEHSRVLSSGRAFGKSALKGTPGTSARADVDNLGKQVMEAAELAGIVADDVQIVSVHWEKVG